MRRALVVLGSIASLTSCRLDENFFEPDPSLERMVEQPRADPYEMLGSQPVLRTPPEGTQPYAKASPTAEPPAENPFQVDLALLQKGHRRFDQFCAPCHGLTGDGESIVAERMARRPPSLHEARIAALADGDIERVILRGYGFMPSHAPQLSPGDGWAVVAYVRALERSQRVRVSELPPALRARLTEATP